MGRIDGGTYGVFMDARQFFTSGNARGQGNARRNNVKDDVCTIAKVDSDRPPVLTNMPAPGEKAAELAIQVDWVEVSWVCSTYSSCELVIVFAGTCTRLV